MVHRGNKKDVEEVEGQRDGNNRDRNRIRDRKNLRVVGRGRVSNGPKEIENAG